MSLTWNGDSFFRRFAERTSENTVKALEHIVDAMQIMVSIEYPPASSPGEAPHLRTGNLQQSIGYDYFEFGTAFNAGDMSGQVTVEADYSQFLEYGTARMAARPFFRRTIREEWGTLKEIMSDYPEE